MKPWTKKAWAYLVEMALVVAWLIGLGGFIGVLVWIS